MQNIAIRIENYKCFGKETGFDCVKRVNIIIGRNNSGKSSLLDVIERVASENYNFDRDTWRDNTPPKNYF